LAEASGSGGWPIFKRLARTLLEFPFLYALGARITRHVLSGRTAEDIDFSPLASLLLRYPIREEFFAVKVPAGDPITLRAGSVPRIYWAGLQTFESDVVPVFLRLCAAAKLVVDIGANAGVFSLLAFRANPHLRIIAVEPNPSLAAALEETFRRNAALIRVVAAAVSDRSGTARLSINEGLSSIMPQRWGQATLVEVATLPFNDLVDGGADLVKIDAEGAELLILEGMRQSLKLDRPHILAELTAESLRQAATLTREYGYRMRALPGLVPIGEGHVSQAKSANVLIDPCGGAQCRVLATLRSAQELPRVE
jgi:FkbM family methyltransferase